jgi:SOS response associated peptidase (SRAP)
MRWGLVPSWSQDPSIGNRMINARAETLLEKPSFKKLVGTKRCVIPADGFYEWRREGNCKVPVWIHLKKREPFVFAGLWDYWRDQDRGKDLYSFTIITCEPNALLRPIPYKELACKTIIAMESVHEGGFVAKGPLKEAQNFGAKVVLYNPNELITGELETRLEELMISGIERAIAGQLRASHS